MKRFLIITFLIVISNFKAQTWKTDEQYIQRFAPYAVQEMEKYKIPASITLAQGLLETGGGQSRLAQEGNNHFGIKCKEDWTGKTMKHTDDAPNECFRVYDDPKDSYEDHSKFLAFRKYYVKLFTLDMKDYKAWAHGLKKAGYATNRKYAYVLIDKIEKNKLYEYDNTNSKEVMFTILKMYPDLKDDQDFMAKISPKKENEKVKIAKQDSIIKTQQEVAIVAKPKPKTKSEILASIAVKTHPNDGIKYFVVPEDLQLSLVSKKFGVNENRLMKYNELISQNLKKNDIIFLESKSTNGNISIYPAEVGENMHDIAQKFGIRLSSLLAKNRMNEGQKPTVGQLIYLQDKKPR